jgi:Biopolymer transport proteins
MAQMFSGNSLWGLVRASDAMSTLVLLSLLGMSIICWAVVLYKYMQLRGVRKQLEHVRAIMQNVHGYDQLVATEGLVRGTVPGSIVTQVITTVHALLYGSEIKKQVLTDKDLGMLQTSIDQVLQDAISEQESYLPVLSTSAEVAPLVGLFGTVWGLIHSFIRISQRQSADIITVAPGIAEALITTLAGLIVAIPAMILYHYINSQVRAVEKQLVAIADKCEWVIKKVLVKEGMYVAQSISKAEQGSDVTTHFTHSPH